MATKSLAPRKKLRRASPACSCLTWTPGGDEGVGKGMLLRTRAQWPGDRARYWVGRAVTRLGNPVQWAGLNRWGAGRSQGRGERVGRCGLRIPHGRSGRGAASARGRWRGAAQGRHGGGAATPSAGGCGRYGEKCGEREYPEDAGSGAAPRPNGIGNSGGGGWVTFEPRASRGAVSSRLASVRSVRPPQR